MVPLALQAVAEVRLTGLRRSAALLQLASSSVGPRALFRAEVLAFAFAFAFGLGLAFALDDGFAFAFATERSRIGCRETDFNRIGFLLKVSCRRFPNLSIRSFNPRLLRKTQLSSKVAVLAGLSGSQSKAFGVSPLQLTSTRTIPRRVRRWALTRRPWIKFQPL